MLYYVALHKIHAYSVYMSLKMDTLGTCTFDVLHDGTETFHKYYTCIYTSLVSTSKLLKLSINFYIYWSQKEAICC